MKIAIITAMPGEFNAVARALKPGTVAQLSGFRALQVRDAGDEFLLLESGIGFDNAARAAGIAIRESRPELLVSTGFCGGIDPVLCAGDVVVAEKVLIANESGFAEIPVEFSPIGRSCVAAQASKGMGIVEGVFVSAAAISAKKRLYTLLSGRYRNLAVEMESGAVAAVAAENNLPFMAIRAVSDGADEELGFSLDEFCSRDMRRIVPSKVLLAALLRPTIVPQLVRLAFGSRKAAKSLTAVLSYLFSTL